MQDVKKRKKKLDYDNYEKDRKSTSAAILIRYNPHAATDPTCNILFLCP